MDVRVADVVFLSVSRVATVFSGELVLVVGFTETVSPVLNHLFFLVLNHNKQQERLIQVPNEANPYYSNAVLFVERIQLPISVTNWVFVEAGDVLESSPFLGVVTRLLSVEDKFTEITISLFGQCSKYEISKILVSTFQSYQLFH